MEQGILVAVVRGELVDKQPIGITEIDGEKLFLRVTGGERIEIEEEECLFPLAEDCSSLLVMNVIEKLPYMIATLAKEIVSLRLEISQHKRNN